MSELSINTNPSSFVALETLNDTNTDLSHTENSVSTGKKVATAGDNPAAFGIDQEIGGEVAGQNAVNDGLSYAASIIDTTTSAANQIIGVLKNIQGTVTSAGDVVGEKGAEQDLDRQITGYLNEIDTISRSATSNGINILAGVSSNGFDISGTSLSYVTSLEGNTASVSNVFSMLARSGLQKDDLSLNTTNHLMYPFPGAHDDMPQIITDDESQKTRYNFGYLINPQKAKTLSAALGLTSDNTPNGSVTSNFLSGVLGTSYLLAPPSQETNYFDTIYGNPGGGLQLSKVMNAAINMVQNAIKGMQYVTAQLGVQSRTIQSLASFGTKLGDNLQDAQGSLVDADMSKESARLNSLQTKQQLSIKSLTIANGQSQSVLSLFQS